MARVPAPARALMPRRRIDLRRIVTADLPLKITAILIAMIFWAVSVLSAPPTEVVRDYGGRVAVQARFANNPPTGTFAGDPAISPTEVRVSGAASQVARIAALYATVAFGDAVTDLVQSVQPTAIDASGATIEGLTVDPAVVQLTVPILPTATTRTVPVVPAVRGSVAAGYWITRVTSDPTVVTVRGEGAALSAI